MKANVWHGAARREAMWWLYNALFAVTNYSVKPDIDFSVEQLTTVYCVFKHYLNLFDSTSLFFDSTLTP